MKALTRGVFWWPRIDSDVENMVKSCNTCQVNRKEEPKVPLHQWECPAKPWSRLHIDFAGPFQGRQFFILVDVRSKWLEVVPVSSQTSQQTIRVLRNLFATHGPPEVVVSDNGPAFITEEFETFLKENGCKHIRCAPYHPASNELAERGVQTLKEAMKKTEGDMETCIARFLFQYRITPHSKTGQSPAELLLGCHPRSRLYLMFPDVGARVQARQERQRCSHNQNVKQRAFIVGDKCMYATLQDLLQGL